MINYHLPWHVTTGRLFGWMVAGQSLTLEPFGQVLFDLCIKLQPQPFTCLNSMTWGPHTVKLFNNSYVAMSTYWWPSAGKKLNQSLRLLLFLLNTYPRSASGQFVVSYMQLVGPHLKIRFIIPLFSLTRSDSALITVRSRRKTRYWLEGENNCYLGSIMFPLILCFVAN